MGAHPLLSLLITVAAVLAATAIGAVVTVLLSAHHTRRQQIEYHAVNVIADAVADRINTTHAHTYPESPGAGRGSDDQGSSSMARRAPDQEMDGFARHR